MMRCSMLPHDATCVHPVVLQHSSASRSSVRRAPCGSMAQPTRSIMQPSAAPYLQRQRRSRPQRAVTAAAAPAAATAIPSTVPVAMAALSNTGSTLVGLGVCLLAAAFSALVFSAIPTLLAWRRTAIAIEQLARVASAEVPDTAAAMRLSGMEVTDAVEELSLLGADITRGVRASAANWVAAETALKQGAAAARGVIGSHVLPAARRGAPAIRDALEGTVQHRAQMSPHSGPAVSSAASAAKVAAQQTRAAINAADLAGKAATLTALLRQRAGGGARTQAGLREPEGSADAATLKAGA